MGEFRQTSMNCTTKNLRTHLSTQGGNVAKASQRVTKCMWWSLYSAQAPNGDFDNLYLDMNGRSAMAGSMFPCKDNAFPQHSELTQH